MADGQHQAVQAQPWLGSAADGDATLLQQLLQQQAAALAQPQAQQNAQQAVVGGPATFNLSLAALLAQQPAPQQAGLQPSAQQQQQQPHAMFSYGDAVPGNGGFGHQGFQQPLAGLLPVPVPGGGFQQTAFGVPQQQAQQTQAGLYAAAHMQTPNFLQQPLLVPTPSSGADGSGTLPPAILQHQQAALAKQQQQQTAAMGGPMLPGLQLPLIPPASVASNGLRDGAGHAAAAAAAAAAAQQPNWAVLQHQAAAAVGAAPLLPVPGLPPFVEQPANSTAHQQLNSGGLFGQQHAAAMAAVSGQQQQAGDAGGAAAASGEAAAPKRRGRQPKDPTTLTEKQLRAREAQKRFRDKQKRLMAETEEAVGAASEELERLRVSNESQKLKNEVLERLLQYKEAQVHALEFQKQMDPPPRFTVSADMVDMMRREGIAGLFTPEVLLRYAVAGYTEHMDERGEVKEPPPFDKVAEDWKEMVTQVKEILDAARQGPDHGAHAAAAAPRAAEPVQQVLPGGRVAEFVELHSSSSGGGATSKDAAAAASASTDHSGRHGGLDEVGKPDGPRRTSLDRAASLASQPAAGAAAARAAHMERAGSASGEVLPDPAEAAATATAAAFRGTNCGCEAPSSSAVGSGGSGGHSRRTGAPITRVPDDVLPEVAAIAEEAPDDVLEAAEAKDDPVARFVLARILSQTAAHSHLNWDTLVEGATVQDGPDMYHFTGKQLRSLAHLMRRVGLMLWQQALLFPHHITKLGTLRLDDPNNLHVEAQDLAHWHGILRRLHCRPEQLRKIVAGHQRYMARMKPVLEERKEAMELVKSMTEFQLSHAWQPNASTASFVTKTTKLAEATGLVMQTISAQHAAYCELLIAIFYALTFPVQRPQLFVLSWPYFPQLQLIGRAAALELGIDISDYPTYSETSME